MRFDLVEQVVARRRPSRFTHLALWMALNTQERSDLRGATTHVSADWWAILASIVTARPAGFAGARDLGG